jgi:hypothetical protein
MMHRLAAIFPVVDNDPKAVLGKALSSRNLGCRQHQLPKYGRIASFRMPDPRKSSTMLRDDKHVRWSLRRHVPKSEHVVGLVHDVGRNLSRENLIKYGRLAFLANRFGGSFHLTVVR